MSMERSSKTPVNYDFSHPGHKLNKQWPMLDLVNGRVASEIGESLAKRLQISLQGTALQTKRMGYSECVSALPNTCIVHEFSLEPLKDFVWFFMDTSVLAAVVDSYFGGEALLETESRRRDLSRTELRVLKHITDAVLTGLVKGWSMVMPLQASTMTAVDVERLSNVPMDHVIVRCDSMFQIGAVELPFQIVYPFESLKPFGERLEHEVKTPSPQDLQFSQALQAGLMDCELDIRGVLAESSITLGKLLELKPGDFIPLRDVQNVSFKTQNMPLFDARVGNSNGRVSASVSRWHLPVSQ